MAANTMDLLTDLLKQVSRSFYLTLRVLPGAVRPQIGLAYLLARATDTIADTGLIAIEDRLKALRALRERILGCHAECLNFHELSRSQGDPAEALLLERIEEAIGLLNGVSVDDRRLIREVLDVITSGQELDLQRFGSAKSVAALNTAAELDDYTYRVAGCVGEFWTKICRAHLFPRAAVDDAALLRDGIRFGKGLQLVNILRDLPKDIRHHRCYLPVSELTSAGLVPADLLEAANEPRLRLVYNRHLELAAAHLAAGWDYTCSLPWTCMRVRLACAWPVLIGIRTLARLRAGNVLDPDQRIKVSRAAVRNIMLKSVLLYPFPWVWRRMFATASRAAA